MHLELLSEAFEAKGDIPALYTCQDKNISPPLSWRNVPDGAKSFSLIVEDPDTPVGTVTHWVIYNIPQDKSELPQAVPHQPDLSDGTIQGRNIKRQNGYMGPCPPWGRHRYYFTLYALDTTLEADPRMTRKKLHRTMKDHILDQASLMGYYAKAKKS